MFQELVNYKHIRSLSILVSSFGVYKLSSKGKCTVLGALGVKVFPFSCLRVQKLCYKSVYAVLSKLGGEEFFFLE